jgi:hypothetical protein
MDYRNKQRVVLGVGIIALIAAAALLVQTKHTTSISAQVLLGDAIQTATAEDKNILVLFGASW